MKHNKIFHTSSLLRKHQMLVEQNFTTGEARYVDWVTYKPVSVKRIAAFETEESI